jgi:hypothetical protein
MRMTRTMSPEGRAKLSAARTGRKRPEISGARHPQWKGGRRLNSYGYVLLYMPEHPLSNSNGMVLEHRLVMSEIVGRLLVKTEQVHHVDDEKTRNERGNLWLFPDAASHIAWHRMLEGGHELAVSMPAIPLAR